MLLSTVVSSLYTAGERYASHAPQQNSSSHYARLFLESVARSLVTLACVADLYAMQASVQHVDEVLGAHVSNYTHVMDQLAMVWG